MTMYSVTEYYYLDIVRNRLFSKFNYKQVREIPRMEDIEVYISINGLDTADSLRVQQAIQLLELLLGKKPKVTSKLSGYVRGTQQQDVLIYSKLVKRELYIFLDLLVFLILPLKHKRRYLEEGALLIGKTGKIYIKDLQLFYNLRTDFVDFQEKVCIEFKFDTHNNIEKRDFLRSFNIPI
jgi:ribosomal protein L5